MSSSVKNSGAVCGPKRTPTVQCVRELGNVVGGQGCGGFEGEVVLAEVEDVAGAQGTAGVSAKAAEDEGAAAAEEGLRVEAAAHGEVGADAFFGGGAEREHAAGFDFDGLPARDELAIELRGHVCAGEGDEGVGVKFEAAAHGGELDGRGVLRVADEAVGDAEGEVVHGAGGWDADVPVADAAGVILQRGLGSAFEEFDGVACEGEGAEEGGGDFSGDEFGRGDDLAEVAEVGFGAVDGCGVERGGELGESFGAVFAVDDDLRDHRVVEGGDGGAGFDPGFYARDFWRREGDERELAGCGLEVVGGVFRVDAGFDGRAVGVDVEA